MGRANYLCFLALSLAFHMTYLCSIFDMYFTDPVVSGSQTFRVEDGSGTVAPAKRLVLFVGDGLRADKTFQGLPMRSDDTNSTTVWYAAPFLRSRILSHGTYGISHTRIPSKTRPGHIAITAGVYEDISALTAEWKPLPRGIDTVFMRSRRSWMWGSPDILPVLKGNAEDGRIFIDTYSESLEDFTANATELDTWVFEKVKNLFQRAQTDRILESSLKEDRTIFFLHLLGPDTTGHAYRPSSQEYLDNISHVDDGVREVTHLIEKFFGDDKTAFIFTADHGISDWGSHGDGHPDNTRTPLVAWGAGIAKPQLSNDLKVPGTKDWSASAWNLDHIQRNDVQQADVAALITFLLGNDFPLSSVGRIPLPYLHTDLNSKALAALTNSRAVLELYRAKEVQKRAVKIGFMPHRMYTRERYHPEEHVSKIQDLISTGKLEQSITESNEMYLRIRESLDYLQTYDWLFLGAIVSMGYISWILFVLSRVIDVHVLQRSTPPSRSRTRSATICCVVLTLFSVFRYECSPWRYYLYPLFPAFFWEQVVANRKSFGEGIRLLLQGRPVYSVETPSWFWVMIFVCYQEILVSSYFRRELMSVGFWLASVYPWMYGGAFLTQHYITTLEWVICCIQMSIFAVVPALKVENNCLIVLGGFCIALMGTFYICYQSIVDPRLGCMPSTKASRVSLGVQVILVIFASILAISSAISLQTKHGLPIVNQVLAWSLLVASVAFQFMHRLTQHPSYLNRLMAKFLAFAPAYVLLTISYEALFYLCIWVTLMAWLQLQYAIHLHKQSVSFIQVGPNSSHGKVVVRNICAEPKHGHPTLVSHICDALMFCFLLHAAIFCAGNTSSLSSFSLESIFRFITVFSPTSQGALLSLKLFIPLLIILGTFRVLNCVVGLARGILFMMVTILLDLIIFRFFLMLRTTGDLFEMGNTINHFLLANVIVLGTSALEFASCASRSELDHQIPWSGLHVRLKSEKSRV